MHSQLFPGPSLPKPPRPLVETSKTHLREKGLTPESGAVLPEISFDMPQLRGNNIREHFLALGQQGAAPYLGMSKEFMRVELPEMPPSWVLDRPGWTRYGSDGAIEEVNDLGDETMVSFDVETLYKLSPYPVIATAVTPNAWYSWLSPTIFKSLPTEKQEPLPRWKKTPSDQHPDQLIPLFTGSTPRVVIGHNVGYDRARVLEEYDLERSSTRWLDTLSLHVATRGITSVQRPAWIKHRKNKLEKILRENEVLSHMQELAEEVGDPELVESVFNYGAENEAEMGMAGKKWEDVTSVNSLADVAALHCGHSVDKSIRNRFGDEDITHASLLRSELDKLVTYCANDVRITHDVYKKVLSLFLDNCPHPASFAGMLSMGNSFLPVNESWERYLESAESKYREMDEGVRKALKVMAEQLRRSGPIRDDPWHAQLDWSPKAARWPGDGPSSSSTAPDVSASTSSSTRSTNTDARGAPEQSRDPSSHTPAWFAPLTQDHSNLISQASQRYLLPLLLRLSYRGHPVAYLAEQRWCFNVPHSAMGAYIDMYGAPVGLSSKDKHLESCLDSSAFFRIPSDGSVRRTKLVGPGIKKLVASGDITSPSPELLLRLTKTDIAGVEQELLACAEDLRARGSNDVWGMQLDWSAEGAGE